MNTKKLAILAVILAVAIGAILLIQSLSNRAPSEQSMQFFTGISGQAIGSIVIKDSQDWVKLQHKGDAWVMLPKQALQSVSAAESQATGLSKAMATDGSAAASAKTAGLSATEFPVDSGTIAQLLDNLLKLKRRADLEISDAPAKQADFEVDSARGCNIEVFDLAGRSLGAVILGTNGPDNNGVYCRAALSNVVYQCLDVSRYAFTSDHKRYADKSVMKFDKATVKQIAIAKRDTSKAGKGKALSIVIARGDSAAKGWQIIEPVKKPADSNKVNEVLMTLSSLQAAEYEDSAYTDSAIGLADPFIKVAVTFTSGTVRTLAIGNAKPGQSKSWMRIPEKPYLYLMNEFEQKKFDKKPDDFAVEPPKPIKPIQAVSAPIPAKYRKAPATKK
jgi:hypothetical protein